MSTTHTETIWNTDELGAGTVMEVSVRADRLPAGELEDHDLNVERPWAIIEECWIERHGAGHAILSRNPDRVDPYGAWRQDMRAAEPTDEEPADRLAETMQLIRDRRHEIEIDRQATEAGEQRRA